ncbi:MarR family winged helix-turn-helix transcriptional regulator [Bifidobacterium aquikefiricola]|uniref:MarR family transcriptional regulator n=1 Tax=Bifidobacterium aquikefiricola TaxID=3059038 RepID=A0AB39U582_9BIFI
MSHKQLAVSLAYTSRTMVLELNNALADCFRPLNLTCVQAEALLALKPIEPATLTELSEHLVAESGHPSRLVSRLVQRGLIERSPSPSDGRANLLHLTEHGRELAQQAEAARKPLIDIVKRNNPEEIERLLAVMRSLSSDLKLYSSQN